MRLYVINLPGRFFLKRGICTRAMLARDCVSNEWAKCTATVLLERDYTRGERSRRLGGWAGDCGKV